jgi:hypothetical protein
MTDFRGVGNADSFDVFERDFPELIEVDGRGNPKQHIDFMAREKEEMRELTQATMICQNIWVRCVMFLSLLYSN